jgi:hypothetical protein
MLGMDRRATDVEELEVLNGTDRETSTTVWEHKYSGLLL